MTDPASASPGPGHRESRLERRNAVARFGVVLLLLLVTYVFLASGPTGRWVPFVAVVLQGATLLAALAASDANRRLWHISLTVVAIGLVSATGVWLADFTHSDGVLFILNALLVGAAPVVIATLAGAPTRRRHPHGDGCTLHLRVARDALGVRLRRDR